MFEMNKEKLEQEKVEQAAHKMFGKMLSQAILESETAPESIKLSVRVLDKTQDLHESIIDLSHKFVGLGKRANAETLKNVLEYLSMVEVGIQRFSESTPFVPADDEEKEEE